MAIQTSKLSVIVPSYQSPHLHRVLESVRRLHPLEVILVDSSPQKPIVNDPSVSLVSTKERCPPGRARNLGAQEAKGEYLLFIDADVVLSVQARSFIEEFMRNPTGPIVCGVYGAAPTGDEFFSRLQNHILNYRFSALKKAGWTLFSSSHFIVKKSVFEAVGGFNEQLWTYEDIEFSARCRHMGYLPQVAFDFVGIHLKQFSLSQFLLDYFRKAFNAFQARRRYKNVFMGVPALVGRRLAVTWALGALILPGCLLSFAFQVPWEVGVAAVFIFLLQPVPFLRRVLSRESFAFTWRALLVWPCIGLTVSMAITAAVVVWYARHIRRSLISLTDLVRTAKRLLFRDGMPIQIIAYVTARCNLRCEHCFYKETLDAPAPGELPVETFRRTTQSIGPVLWFALGGGEPFVRKDLDQIIEVVQRNCRPRIFSFPTNGWYAEKTFLTSLRILQQMETGNFMLFFSLDGPQEIHDQIRGVGSFDRVKATMQRLRPLQAMYPNFYLNVITTVTDRNAHAAAGFIEELVSDFEPSSISINLFRYHSLRHPRLPDHVIEGYRAATATYEKYLRAGALKHYGFFGGRVLLWKEILQKDLIYRVARHNEFVTPCTAGTLSYVIMEDGRISACEILPDTIGLATDTKASFTQIVKAAEARKLRRWIRDTECRCTYECAMSTNTLFSWPMTRRLARALVKEL